MINICAVCGNKILLDSSNYRHRLEDYRKRSNIPEAIVCDACIKIDSTLYKKDLLSIAIHRVTGLPDSTNRFDVMDGVEKTVDVEG